MSPATAATTLLRTSSRRATPPIRRGITINGLAILSDDPRLDIYYRRSVIGGQDAFVEVAHDFTQFATAIRQKLIREIYPPELSLGSS